MNKGDIQQVGTPKDIYQRPANLFVATFIGRSNVLDGELRMENGKPVLHFHAGASITLDNVRAEECKNQPVKISVRPEEFILDASTDATGLKATVDSSVFLGLNTHYFAHTDDGDKIEIIQESQIDSIIRMARSSVSASRPRRSTCLTRKASRTCWKVSATTTPFNGQEAVP